MLQLLFVQHNLLEADFILMGMLPDVDWKLSLLN